MVDAELDEIHRMEGTDGGAWVTLTSADSAVRSAVVHHSLGTKQRPMAEPLVHEKFERLTGGFFDGDYVR